jgi:hypothetical protein
MSLSQSDPNEHALAVEIERQCAAVCRAYGLDRAPTEAERRAYAAMLDRMGAFSTSERNALIVGGVL